MARKKSSSKPEGKVDNASAMTPQQALVDRECFEGVTKAFEKDAIDRELSSKKAFAAVREVLTPKLGEISLNWLRQFMRLLEAKKVVHRLKRRSNGKNFTLRLGNLTYRPSRRNRKARGNGETPARAPRVRTSPRVDEVRLASPGNEGLVPLIDQKIANLEAELEKLKRARDLLV